jgi:hypothetical protein
MNGAAIAAACAFDRKGSAGYQTPAHRVSQTVAKKGYSVGEPSPHTPRQSGPDGLSDRRASSRDEVPGNLS